MKKKIYIILVVAVICGGIGVSLYTVSSAQTSSTLPSPSYTIADTFPVTNTIEIGTPKGTVQVNNFYKTLVDTEEGSVIMKESAGYEIFYDRSSSQFYIYLATASSSQAQAETDLLNILGVGQSDACKLSVSVLRPGQTNSTGLSFCAN